MESGRSGGEGRDSNGRLAYRLLSLLLGLTGAFEVLSFEVFEGNSQGWSREGSGEGISRISDKAGRRRGSRDGERGLLR